MMAVDRFDAFATFVAVADEAGFAAGARRVGRSPAAVTRTIAALEGELGTPRGRQGTPREKVVLPYGWLDSTEIGDADLAEAESDASGG